MATYSQWDKRRKLTPLTWVCGAEPALVREVTTAYRAGCPADGTSVLWAGSSSDREVWDTVLSDPLGAATRLLLIYAAERLKEVEPMAALAAGAPSGRVVFVSGSPDFAREGDVLAPHLACIQASKYGQMIRCARPGRAEDLVKLVASWWPGSGRNLAAAVLTRCGGDLALARQGCEKATAAGLAPTDSAVAAVCVPGPAASFADPLIAGHKAAAMAAARQAGREITGPAIGLLETRLSVLALIGAALRAGTDPRDLPAKVRGADRFLVRMLAPFTGSYSTDRIARCREVLAVTGAAHRSGATRGVAELLVARW